MSTTARSPQSAQQTQPLGVTSSQRTSSKDPVTAVVPALSWRGRLVGLVAAVALASTAVCAFSFLSWVAA